MDIIYRFDPDFAYSAPPSTPAEAVDRLHRGNVEFVELSNALDSRNGSCVIDTPPPFLDLSHKSGSIPVQAPFAVVLGCSDARVPPEQVFSQTRNDFFGIRVAGNVLGSECLGSIEYAVHNVADNLKLVIVLGHSNCGAVTAAVDAFLEPPRYTEIASSPALRSVVDRIFISVRAARRTLDLLWGIDVSERDGYREALIDVSAGFNAALTAWTLKKELPPTVLERVGVVFGLLDLSTHQVWAPGAEGKSASGLGLTEAPSNPESFSEFGKCLGERGKVRDLLDV